MSDTISYQLHLGVTNNREQVCIHLVLLSYFALELFLSISRYRMFVACSKIIASCTLYTKTGIFYFCNRSTRLIYVVYVR